MSELEGQGPTSTLIGGVQLLLAEKRTALAVLRTGIAVFAVPLGVLSLLVATSRNYEPAQVLHLLVPVLIVCAGLLLLASYLVARSIRRIRRIDAHVEAIKASTPSLRPFLD